MALSDPGGILASPLTIIERKDEPRDIETIVRITGEQQVGIIVIGLPRSLDGSLGKQAEKVQSFTRELCRYLPIPVEFRDERLTTVSARRLRQDTKQGKGRGKVHDDAVAAAIILQAFLDEGHQPETE